MKKLYLCCVVLLVSVFVSSCGGGGGGSAPVIIPPQISCNSSGHVTSCVAEPGTNRQALRIQNTATSSVTMDIKLNDKLFFKDFNDIIQHVNQLSDAIPDEPFEIKLMRFIGLNSGHSTPFSGERWEHNPLVFLNSLGLGLCDDNASVMYFLAHHHGISARVWGLSGHVVPELYIDGAWRLFDPYWGVYYKDRTGSISGVEKLQEDGSLILDPYEHLDFVINQAAYGRVLENVYTSDENNELVPWYQTSVVDIPDTQFTIPPGAIIEFPGHFVDVIDNKSEVNTDFATMKITVTMGNPGTLITHMKILSVSGDGTAYINTDQYDINSATFQTAIVSHDTYINGFSIAEARSDIEVVYLVNPVLSELQQSNTVKVTSSATGSVNVELVNYTY